MRTGPRIAVACVVAFTALSAPALAADTLTVFVDNPQTALGGVTTLAAHAETDAGYGGGHISFKYRPGPEQCAPTPAEDTGQDANGDTVDPVNPGAAPTDVGGQMVQFAVGSWRVCGWLVDDATGATVATSSTVVTVVPYMGSVSLSVKRVKDVFEVVVSYSTSSAARLSLWLQRGSRKCAGKPRNAVYLVPRAGRLVGGDGGIGRALAAKKLAPGKWRACAALRATAGSAGPASKAFAVRSRKRRAGHAAG